MAERFRNVNKADDRREEIGESGEKLRAEEWALGSGSKAPTPQKSRTTILGNITSTNCIIICSVSLRIVFVQVISHRGITQ